MNEHYHPRSLSKIADISTDDVKSYVKKLIGKELGPMIIANDSAAKTRKTIASQHKNPENRPERCSKKKELADA